METIRNIDELENKFDDEIILMVNGQEKRIEEPAVIYHEKEGRFAIGELKEMQIRFRALKTKFEINGVHEWIASYHIVVVPKDKEFIGKVLADKFYISNYIAEVEYKQSC